ncbi:unnamed protein product [Mycena citricolor]|uniref:Large ribosomal subunit protein bL32m n=1 Tax=Mycena citricolor TaxID=2018698 RepID=A0AAD2HR25_9AGAR|nr:unnamed protein product [Mycena citricolor]
MAALTTQIPRLTRPIFARTPYPLLPTRLWAFAVPSLLTGSRAWSMPSLQSLLEELFPPFVLAVPKKKTSHSRKAMREANKGLKDKQNIVHCPGCGAPKLAHHLCSNCYSFLSRMWKQINRENPL